MSLARPHRALPSARGAITSSPKVSVYLTGTDQCVVLHDQSGIPLLTRGGSPVLQRSLDDKTFPLALKRVIDVIGSAGLLVLLAPLFFAVAIAVKATSPGPVFFTQLRHGLLRQPFTVYKFRTLYHAFEDKIGTRQVVGGDARVTPLGRFLRRTAIDEMPQLLNVLRGEMSLVGPRPHAIGMLAAGQRYEELVPHYHMRHLVKPGLTGWAQAHGLRGPTIDANLATARINHDLAYIQNYSLWLDLRTLWLTVSREMWRQVEPSGNDAT